MKSILLAATLAALTLTPQASAETWQCTTATGHKYTSSQSVPVDRCKIVAGASNPFEAGSGAPQIVTATGAQRCIGMKSGRRAPSLLRRRGEAYASAPGRRAAGAAARQHLLGRHLPHRAARRAVPNHQRAEAVRVLIIS